MCKQVCEQTEEGRALWQRWRETGKGWKAVIAFHHNAILDAMRAEAEKGAQFTIFACERREQRDDHDPQ